MWAKVAKVQLLFKSSFHSRVALIKLDSMYLVSKAEFNIRSGRESGRREGGGREEGGRGVEQEEERGRAALMRNIKALYLLCSINAMIMAESMSVSTPIRTAQTPSIMAPKSAVASSWIPMPLRTTRKEPVWPYPLHVTTYVRQRAEAAATERKEIAPIIPNNVKRKKKTCHW